MDDLFNRYSGRRTSRKLLFSTVVALLSLVVCRVRNSVHASYQLLEQELCVGVKAGYNRLNSLPVALIEALVRESAFRMFAIVDALRSPIPGFQTRIVDGNHLATTEHRIQSLPEKDHRLAAVHELAPQQFRHENAVAEVTESQLKKEYK